MEKKIKKEVVKPVNEKSDTTEIKSKMEVKTQLNEEMTNWQETVEKTKAKIKQEAKEAKLKIQPHLDELDQEFEKAKAQWELFDDATEKAWNDIKRGLESSFKTMQRSFNKAETHFQKPKK